MSHSKMIPATRLWIPLASLALCACGGGGGGGGTMPPPSGNSNTAPAISGLAADQTLLKDSSSEPIAFEIGDAESDAAELQVSVTSSNEAVLPVAGIQLSGEGASRTLLLTPEIGKSGSTDVTVSVKDPEGLAATHRLALQVTTERESLREFTIASIDASPDSEPAEVAGHTWTDTGADDPAAYDPVLATIAE
jgi:hypothetical protein